MNQKPAEFMRLIVASPDGELLNISNVDWVNAILATGYPVSIYSNHAPLVALLSACNLKYRIEKSGFLKKPISAGILSVKDNLVRIWIGYDESEKASSGSSEENKE